MKTTPAPAPIRVVFVLQDHSLVLDWAGPAEALRIANQLLQAAGQPERFILEFAGPQAQTTGSVGITLAGFSSDTQLRRCWHDFGLAGTPSGAGS